MSEQQKPAVTTARTASTDWLLQHLVPLHLQPPPRRDTFNAWLRRNRVPCVKANPDARRGGGVVYWSVCHVERLLQVRACRATTK